MNRVPDLPFCGMTSNGNHNVGGQNPSSRPKTLMESLLVAKMEQLGHPSRQLVRTDSADSTSSMGSVTSINSDVCRCDDCLLGIADLYAQEPTEGNKVKKKVSLYIILMWLATVPLGFASRYLGQVVYDGFKPPQT